MSYFIYHGKKIFYREVGEGKPVLFLHGNTASSKMFEFILPLYQADCRCFFDGLFREWQVRQGGRISAGALD